MKPTREQICQKITQLEPEARRLLRDLISFPSITPDENEIVEFCHQEFGQLDAEAKLVPFPQDIKDDADYTFADQELFYEGRHNLVVERPGTGGGRSIILQTHLDVVPAEEDWPDAFHAREEGDLIYGRGAVDCKGQVPVIYLALKALEELGIKLKGDVCAQLVIEEEVGGNGALALIKQGYRADGAIVMEGSRLQIHPANRGALWFRLRIVGKSVHMGRKHQGVSALEKAVQVMGILDRYEEKLVAESQGQPLFAKYEYPVQVNIGTIHGGTWPAAVPGEVVLEGGIGFLPNKQMAEIKEELRQAILEGGDDWLKSHFELDFPKLHNDAYQTDPHHPMVQTLQQACDQAGLNSEVSGWNVSCDARLYHHRGQMPTVVFGAGDIAQAHARDEQIARSEILEGATALTVFLLDWCGIG